MKKKVIIICSICIILLLGLFILDKNLTKNYFTEIKYQEFVDKINNKEDFIVVVSQTTCSHCASYKPKVEQVANDKKIKIFYIEYDLLSDSEKKEFKNYIAFNGTPETVFFKDGYEKSAATRISGEASVDKILAKLKTNGFL